MAQNPQITYAITNAQADLLARALDNGFFRIFGGVLGVTYLIQILATTSAGRKIMGARTLKIVQGGAP